MDTRQLVTQILAKLNLLETQHAAEQARLQHNREKAINLIHFVNDTIKAVAPDKIESVWFGSYDNSGVADYPTVTLHAMLRHNHQYIATWKITADGSKPPKITKMMILEKIHNALEKIG